MRVIRPARLYAGQRRRLIALAAGMILAGLAAGQLALMAPSAPLSGAMAGAAAIGLGVGAAWLVRAVRPSHARRLADRMASQLSAAFDDSYVLVLGPRLPIRDAARLDGVLIGPAGVRVVTMRDWEGRYRVRGRVWEFDARGKRGWIRCRTNPSFDAIALAHGVARWASEAELGELPVRGVVAFPGPAARIVLEEPDDEVLTSDNAPWWANSIGRVRRLDPADGARLLEAVLDESERAHLAPGRRRVAGTA